MVWRAVVGGVVAVVGRRCGGRWVVGAYLFSLGGAAVLHASFLSFRYLSLSRSLFTAWYSSFVSYVYRM